MNAHESLRMNIDTDSSKPLLEIPAVAERLKAHRNWVLEQISKGDLRAIRVGRKYLRVREEDLLAWMEKHATLQEVA